MSDKYGLNKTLIVSGTVVATIACLLGWLFFAGGATWIGAQFGVAPIQPVGPDAWLYTTGMTANFKVQDATLGTIMDDTMCTADLYANGATPFALGSIDTSVAVGTFDALTNTWSVVANAGTYKMLIDPIGGYPTYPTLVTVTVPGTNTTLYQNVVQLSPYLFSVKERATLVLTAATFEYNAVSGLYEPTIAPGELPIPGAGTLRYLVSYTFNVGGIKQYIAAGRVYLPVYTGVTVTSAKLGNDVVSVRSDVDATDDGLIGYYIELPDLTGGTTMVLNVYLTLTTAAGAGNYEMAYVEQYLCMNPNLRWWVDETALVLIV